MKRRFLAWWEDIRTGDLNPVMVRELRQYLRSRFANWIVILMLAGLVLVTMGFFAEARSRVTVTGVEIASGSGGAMFGMVAGVLSIASVLLALYTAQRMGAERDRQNLDLLFTTILRPGQVVRGKLFAGLAMFSLFLSLAMPFMTMTYMMRGIDVRVILWGLLSLAVGSTLALSGAILLGCLPFGPLFRRGGIAFMVVFVWLSLGVVPFMLRMGSRAFRHSGVTLSGWDWQEASTIAAILVCAFVVPYSLSILLLSHARSNRFFPFRLTMTGLWLASMAVVAAQVYISSGGVADVFLPLWFIPGMVFFLALLQVSESMEDVPGPRVLRHVPRSFLGRLASFPFFTGGIQGTVWALALLVGYGAMATLLDPEAWVQGKEYGCIAVIFGYAVCYILTARLISARLPLSLRQGAGTPWLITLYMVATAAFVPVLVDNMRDNRTISFDLGSEPGNLFAMFRGNEDHYELHLLVAGIWLGAVLLLNLPRLFRTFAAFRRPAEEVATGSEP